MKNVTIDTNFFISHSYNFSSKFFYLLKKLINNGEIKLVLSSVVEQEILTHYKEEVEKEVSIHNCNLNTLRKTLNGYSLFDINKEEAIDYASNLFKKFIKDFSIQIADVNLVKPNEVFKDYFAKKGAFSTKKSNEFKDSFAYKSIKKFLNNEKIYVLSRDNDWASMAKEYDDEVFSTSDSLLKRLFSFDEHIELLCSDYIKNNKTLGNEVENGVLDELNVCKYFDEDIEPENFEVLSTSLFNAYVIDKDDSTNTIELIATFKVIGSQEVIYDDYDNAVWDSEDKEYVYLPKSHCKLTYIFKPSFTIVLTYHSNDDGDILIDGYEVVEKPSDYEYENVDIEDLPEEREYDDDVYGEF